MKNYFLLVMFIICASFKAQETIIKVDSATGGRLVINTEQEILKMIDDEGMCKKLAGSSSSAASTSSDATSTSGKTSTGTKTGGTRPGGTSGTKSNVCGKRNDIPGFMIKVGEAKTEQDFNTMMSNFRSEFPELRVERSYLRPDWRLLAGDYFKKESGQADLKRIRKNYPTAVLINWRIYCNRAK